MRRIVMRYLKSILNKASEEERTGLQKILESESNLPDALIDNLQWNAQSIFGYMFKNISYKRIVHQVAKKLKINFSQSTPISKIEIKIAQNVLKTVWEKMTPEQRKKFEQELQKTAKEFDKTGGLIGSTAIFAFLTGAQLSGFGIYLLASTALGAITGTIGITLPFAVYTTMSSVIFVVIGPVGWIGAGLFAIWKLTGPNYKRLIPAIIYISALKAKQKGNFK